MNYKLFLLLTLLNLGFTQHADTILKQSDKSRILADETKIEIQIETYEKGELIESENLCVYNQGKNKSLVKFEDKRRNGQLVLSVDENMWIYFPRTRKPLRITPFQRLMGEASNGDIARLSYSEDYNATVLREDTLENVLCDVLELSAKSKSSTYKKIHYWVSKKDHLPKKAEYFLISGKHFKSSVFETYQKINNQYLLGSMRFHNVATPEKVTVMRFKSYSETKVPDKFFNKNYLPRVNL